MFYLWFWFLSICWLIPIGNFHNDSECFSFICLMIGGRTMNLIWTELNYLTFNFVQKVTLSNLLSNPNCLLATQQFLVKLQEKLEVNRIIDCLTQSIKQLLNASVHTFIHPPTQDYYFLTIWVNVKTSRSKQWT